MRDLWSIGKGHLHVVQLMNIPHSLQILIPAARENEWSAGPQKPQRPTVAGGDLGDSTVI